MKSFKKKSENDSGEKVIYTNDIHHHHQMHQKWSSKNQSPHLSAPHSADIKDNFDQNKIKTPCRYFTNQFQTGMAYKGISYTTHMRSQFISKETPDQEHVSKVELDHQQA